MPKANLKAVEPAVERPALPTRQETIAKYQDQLAVQQRQLTNYQRYVERQELLIGETELEITYLEAIDDDRFACEIEDRDDEEAAPAGDA